VSGDSGGRFSKIIQSYIKDGGLAFPKPGKLDNSGDHSKEYADLPSLKRG
jgi:hypothetical protein